MNWLRVFVCGAAGGGHSYGAVEDVEACGDAAARRYACSLPGIKRQRASARPSARHPHDALNIHPQRAAQTFASVQHAGVYESTFRQSIPPGQD